MALAIPASAAHHEPRLVLEAQKLPPRPDREVLAIAAAGSLEFLRDHPMVRHAELLLIGYVAAGREERSYLIDVPAGDFERLTQEGSHRASGKVVALLGFGHASAHAIVVSGDGFRDHGSFPFIPAPRP